MSTVPTVLPNPGTGAPAQYVRAQEYGHADAAWTFVPPGGLRPVRMRLEAFLGSTSRSAFDTRHSEAMQARQVRTILIELGIGSPSDWTECGREPAKFLGRTFERFIKSHAEPAIDRAFELSVTLSTDPHEWCETEDEPDGSQMFIYMEAASCGFVNLGPALTLCEKVDPRLPGDVRPGSSW